ncbi:MAG: NAD-glutamate dehydrogenase [Actinobacteria bacterium]|nr:NAD-glutamate dehydrogenase [Actinomycetota bacterium]
MTVDVEEAKAGLIDEAASQVREHLPRGEVAQAERFLRQYYAQVPADDLVERDVIDVYGAALAHRNLGRRRTLGAPRVRVYTPQFETDGWQSTHSVVEIINEDMPFLVDSVTNELSRHGLGIHLVVHPMIAVRRDHEGALLDVLEPGQEGAEDSISESFIHVEVDRQTDHDFINELKNDIERVLGDVRAAVGDWQDMLERVRRVNSELDEHPPPIDPEDVAEAKDFLQWIYDGNFTLLGYREYQLLEHEGKDALMVTPGSGLGILRQADPDAPPSIVELPHEARKRARERKLFVLTKANSRATVHRPNYLDYIGVKRFEDAGGVIGEWRFLGLYTSTAYNTSPTQIPFLRRKVGRVVERSGFPAASHSRKDLEAILESYPRDELFQASTDELYRIAMGILYLQERQRVRLFVRRDTYGRFFSCLVFIPRDRYNTAIRLRMQDLLTEAFEGTSVEYTTRVSESVLARLHFIIRTDADADRSYDVEEIEKRLVAAVRSWSDDLRAALVEELGEEHGIGLFRTYGEAFPGGYRDDTVPRRAVFDIKRLEALERDEDLGMGLYHLLEAPQGFLRFKLYRSGSPMTLSEILPLLEHMGAGVIDQRPYEVNLPDGETRWIYDLGLACGDLGEFETDGIQAAFQETFARVWRHDIEDDGFNRLTLSAGLSWRDIAVLRALSRYLRQTGSRFSQAYMEDTLVANPHIARWLIDLFHARFDPATRLDAPEAVARHIKDLEEALDAVQSLDQDRILRSFLTLVLAMLRTNYYQSSHGRPKAHLSFKLDPSKIEGLPLPRPMFEIFVYSPRVEGVHLRGGKVARGGIRWSDRREDFRTEILGLMKAQQVKNAIIVPVGAKGGFVVKRPPEDGDRDALFEEVKSCYQNFIHALLDVTDNLVDGKVVPPEDVVRYDEDDPYLVVAADKGTATFSDFANAISEEYGFWLGDAFASGGSVGYDHKKMGITARGAWESVKHHFRERGVDVQTTDFTVVGIGDMSGDVFGNGMLLSRNIKLIGAFDHRHIFIDPDPDPEASFQERERLFGVARSSWADYDEALISPGGGVYPRTAKSISLSKEAQRALGIDEAKLAPLEVIKALLRAPVELLWNGGIGTYVKASTESHAEAGDKVNDLVRVDASELRCHVVGEGGNLGFTQRARVEYALASLRINTDSIDNSAGVDCSDHEVNIKILLNAVVAQGDMTEKQRNSLLAEMTDEVGKLVLRDNYQQTRALSNSVTQAVSMVDVHTRYLGHLEQRGKLDREVEFLPNEEEVEERKSNGKGLASPEFAILLAYSKIGLKKELLASDLPEDPYLARELVRYFPEPLRERFSAEMERHRLRREIIATRVANAVVNTSGITFVFRLGEETGAAAPDIARAQTVAREIFDMESLWSEIERLDHQVDAATQTAMILEGRTLVERGTRWLLRHCSRPLDISATVERYKEGTAELTALLPEVLVGPDQTAREEATRRFVQEGVPEELATSVAGLTATFSALDLVEVSGAVDEPVASAAAAYFLLGNRLQLHWLRDCILALPRDDRWQALARDALRNDLYGWHGMLTAEALKSTNAEHDAEDRINAWFGHKGHSQERYRQILDDIRAVCRFDLATLSVALREVRNLAEDGTSPASSGRSGS